MKTRFICVIVLLMFSLNSCRQESKPAAQAAATPTALIARGVSAGEAKAAFDSPEALTRLLEQRWPVAAIHAFCIPERGHDNAYQNLVLSSPKIWEGTLHHDAPTGFDRIAWYATTKSGRADQFSLGVERGKDFWLLEIGNEETVQKPPDWLPDSSRSGFIGHR